ncbi:hypothetical protein TYRP_000331 [Tyrophagus putrescentiae]|nr:hypothetical protein TYRP_000331 [Tyrophagus putrescentiae]
MFSLTELLFSSVVTLLGVVLLKWYRTRCQIFRTFTKLGIPGPEPRFWLGNLHFSNRDYVFDHLDTWFKRYGDYFGYYRGDRPVIVVKNMEIIHEVFIARFKEFPNRLKFRMNVEPFSSSVLALRVSQLSQSKSILESIKSALKTLKTASNDHITVESLADIGVGEGMVVNVNILSKAFTLDVISRIAFALEESDVFEPNSHLLGMAEEFMANCDGPIIRLVLMFPFLSRVIEFINNYLTSGRMVDMLSKHLKKLIEQYHIKEFLDVPKENDTSSEAYIQKRNMLDYMLFQGKVANLSTNETIGNLLVVLFAGYETSSCCLAFALFNIAKHRDVQQKLRSELQVLLSGDNFEDWLEQLSELKCEYLDRVIYESLRLYPPVVDYIIREISGDLDVVTLKCGLKVPKEVGLMFPIRQMHLDASIWPEPFRFNPERDNLPIPGSSVKNYAFAAFGIGQRRCVGDFLATTEIRQIIAALVLRYRIELVSDPRSVYAHRYRYDQNRLLQVECIAELIKPKDDIYLHIT